MADFNEVLDALQETQSFFRWETREYKDFRDNLSNLNKAMIAAGDHPLSAGELQNLRELTARAREAWGNYLNQITEKVRAGMEQDNPVNPLSSTERRRMQILDGMTALLDGDLDALRNADPRMGRTLGQVILDNRALTADVRGKEVPIVGTSISSRMVVEVNGQKGAFTEDYIAESVDDTREKYAQKYPQIGQILHNMGSDGNYADMFISDFFTSPEDLAGKLLNKTDPTLNHAANLLLNFIQNNWGIQFPAEMQNPQGTVWFDNPEFVRQFSDSVFNIARAKDLQKAARAGGFETGNNVPRRNAAMSAVADRLGVPEVVARSKVMRIQTDQGEKTGVFMEWADGKDLRKIRDEKIFDDDLMGKKKRFTSTAAIKSASNLQVLDYICGNVDRHDGNMMYKFEDIDGVMTVTGVQGIDNDASFGLADYKDGTMKLAGPGSMHVMTKSMAETVLNLTEDELKYSLYGLVNEDEIRAAWARTEILQTKIKESLKAKWKSDSSVRAGVIRILDDNSPAWEKLDMNELVCNRQIDENGGVFSFFAEAIDGVQELENEFGVVYQDHTREGVRTSHYQETDRPVIYGDLRKLTFPGETENCTDDDVFGLYRNRRTLHQNQDAVQKGARFFDSVFQANIFFEMNGEINREMGMAALQDCIFIDGQKASEYVGKYAPDQAGNADYVKAQIMAALTSGRHHVDYVCLRTDSKGHFKTSSTELTMDLSRLNRKQHFMEVSRETRRKGLIKDEDTRMVRQKALEESILQRAEETADRKTEELIANDVTRGEVFQSIPYQEFYQKSQAEREARLDQAVTVRDREDIKRVMRKPREESMFKAAKKAIDPGEAAPAAGLPNAPENAGRRRERMSLEALGLEAPRRQANHRNQPNQAQQAPQNPQNQAANQLGQPGNQPDQAGNEEPRRRGGSLNHR
ncbi:MAG: hypothetical protein K6E83_08695 [Clostridium sp.]|nr:hypothetical protein [Clostridium sp.]